jgi:hypothetical protein
MGSYSEGQERYPELSVPAVSFQESNVDLTPPLNFLFGLDAKAIAQ